ncbi:hypothetical protein BDE36_3889 [Arcticibacter tournemirensis]|uniref:DUF4625 domain-containing protein n=1 Tax=Arcticibacter tournemirensis TaxID=699437 RepID=A0A5M9HIN8_9SPHI|nr:hypothetical protein [Arcticibacter tournemirensis]KAA8486283.1 hypothetical protein F1649_01470 [Arcticibacter tournemirensis]TQM52090.1 hypothetical protein BDE36_3889 [Arcticibacter tournemirensis]
MKTSKFLFTAILCVFLSACSKDNAVLESEEELSSAQSTTPGSQQAQISNIVVPEASKGVNPVKIKATVTGSSSCWTDLRLSLTKSSKYNYVLKAYGTVGTGSCENTPVTAAREASFTPDAQGTYTITIYKTPNTTVEKKVQVIYTR